MKYRSYKPFAFLLTTLLALQPVPAHAITFVDLSDVPWSGAAGPIQRAGNLGLVVGDVKNGMHYFRPNASVSLCETAQLAYKLLLHTGKANLSDTITQKWSVVLSNYNLPTWSYDALSYCLEADIITPTELNGYMVNGNPQSATREQAARIFGRTLKYGAPAYSTTSTDTKFADNYQISDTAKSYVALLNEKGIVNGDNTNRFNPKKTLNRAETAVLVTKLYDLMAKSSSFISGTPSYLYPSTGSFVTGTTTNTTTNVTAGTTGTVSANTKTGKIKTLTKHYINLEGDTGSYFFDTTKAPTITVDEERYSVDELVRLWSTKPILKATLTLSGSNTITKLEIEKNSKLKSSDLKGEIKSLSKSKIKVGSKTFSIEDADDITVKIDGKTEDFDELRDLYKDDDVKLTATLTLDSDDYVIKIVVTTDDSDEDDGELTGIGYADDDDYEGYIRVDGRRYYVEDVDDITVKIEGSTKDFDRLYDLYRDLDTDEYIEVEIETDGDDYVTRIKATIEDEDDDDDDKDGDEEGEITDLDDDEIELDDDDSYDLDNDVDVDVTDGETTIDDLDDLIDIFEDDKVIEVEITIKNGDVTKIEGEVIEARGRLIDCGKNSIELEFDESDDTEYKFDKDLDEDEIDVDFDGESKIKNLEDFLDWLDDEDFDADDDDILITLKLEDGYVTEFEAEWD